jgi:type IV pilus assembly protein PilC
LAALYGLAAVAGAAALGLARWGQASAGADLWLRRVPLFGGLRRNLALSRFCAVYEMQLQAAINLMDALRAAASASRSALVRRDVERAIPRVLQGEGAAIALTGSQAFPAALQRALRLGEETGSLDEGLRQWSDYYREAALRNLRAIGNWLPRILFLLIAVYVGYVVISVYYWISVEPLDDLLKQ